jgi:tetratricopeptide (TPR) repeat protein
MSNNCISVVVELLDCASSADGEGARAQCLANAREAVAECLKVEADSADVNYIAGLVMYRSFCIDERYGERAEEYLRRANRLNPNHQFARLYLGHYYYDIGEYSRALEYFESVNENYFTSIDQVWRVLKLHELILCCKMFVASRELTEGSFEALAKEYLAASPEDVPVPTEIVAALAKTVNSSIWSTIDREVMDKVVLEMIERLDVSEAFKASARETLSEPH